MTGAEVYAYILRTFKRTDKETEVYESITDVVWDLKTRFEWENAKEYTALSGITSLGNYTLSLPSDYDHIIGDVVVIDTGTNEGGSTPLEKLTKERFDELYPNPEASSANRGFPQFWCLYAEEVLIAPVPDDTGYSYKANMTTNDEGEITSTTTSVAFTPKYRETIKNLTLAKVFDGLDSESARKYEALGEIGLNKMVSSELNNLVAPSVVEFQAY